MVYNFFDKKSAFCGDVKNENMSKQDVAKELHKAIFRKLKKVHF